MRTLLTLIPSPSGLDMEATTIEPSSSDKDIVWAMEWERRFIRVAASGSACWSAGNGEEEYTEEEAEEDEEEEEEEEDEEEEEEEDEEDDVA